MAMTASISGYRYDHARLGSAHTYLLPTVIGQLHHHFSTRHPDRRVFDLGCGNGAVAASLAKLGYSVTGVDPSLEGVCQAKAAFPSLCIEQGSAYDDLAARFGRFPALISLEVVEHVYAPRDFAKTAYNLLEPGGIAVISTPYHGYLKNVVIAVSNKFDKHVDPLWDHGHIKFWSKATLATLLNEAGFTDLSFYRVGRMPVLAKSMMAVARKSS